MAKPHSQFVCQACGASYVRWQGRCEACDGWNTLIEETVGDAPPKGLGRGKGAALSFVALDGAEAQPARLTTGISEFDRVCGGGIVLGSALLIGGDPGIGKSTLLLQAAAALSRTVGCAYISGEEAIDQIRLRATRLGSARNPVQLAAATSIRDIVTSLDRADTPKVVVIDSIQTMYLDTLDSAPGTVTQVRASAQELIRLAKKRGFAVLLVGHVTKDGLIAGPRVLEHMVDCVLYFEGERSHQFRILRAMKNRFGPTDELGVFEMTGGGLVEVPDPSAVFLADARGDVSGTAVFAGMEGSRPMLLEIQALVAPSALATPRRAVVGWDSARLAMILAVLEARCGLSFAGRDVFLNVTGGLRISEPAADLAVAAALLSVAADRPGLKNTVVFGEIGLSGEVRPVSHRDQRLKEASKLGFTHALAPAPARRSRKAAEARDVAVTEIGHLRDLLGAIGVDGLTRAPAPLRAAGE